MVRSFCSVACRWGLKIGSSVWIYAALKRRDFTVASLRASGICCGVGDGRRFECGSGDGEEGNAVQNILDGAHQVAGGLGFDNVAEGAGGFEGVGEFGGLVHGEDQDAGANFHLNQLGEDFKAIFAGHADIEDDEVGIEGLSFGDGVESVASLADDLPLGMAAQDEEDAVAYDIVVIDNEDTVTQFAS